MGVFFGLLKIQIFFGVLEIPDIFLGCTIDAGSEPTYTEKNESTPPPPPLGVNVGIGVDVRMMLSCGKDIL